MKVARRLAAVALFVSALAAHPRPALAVDFSVTKVLVGDSEFAEITNTGTLTAVSRLLVSSRLNDEVRTNAIEEVLTGARASGSLVPTTLVSGDSFLALDQTTGLVIVVHYVGETFVLPSGSTNYSKWLIPIG
jgi:hypothetical protein